jgi:hypothetical protein
MATHAATVTAHQRQVLQLVYDEHRMHGTWPAFGILDRRLARSRPNLDLAQLVAEVSESFLLPLWSGGVPPEPDALMKLTIQGVALCDGARDDVDLFLRALRWIARRELTFEPEEPHEDSGCIVTGRELMRAFRLPSTSRPVVDRLGQMLHIERWGWSTAASNDWNWRFTAGRRVRRYARVHSIDDYVAANADRVAGGSSHIHLANQPVVLAGSTSETSPASLTYLDISTIDAVEDAATAGGWSSDKLVALLRELNDNYSRGNAYACHALLRGVLDHIPPMLDCTNFSAVVSNVSWSRTDRSYMKRLLDFKLQADDALHRQISTKYHDLAINDLPPAVWLRRLLAACAHSAKPVGT